MKYSIILCVFLMSGCSTLAQLGEVEGLGKTGEVIRAIESSRVVLGGTPTNRDVAAVVNRTVGEVKSLDDMNSTIPQQLQRFGYILENVSGGH